MDKLNIPAIQSLSSFTRALGVNDVTIWRFRRKGWLQTTNINGRQYVTAEQVMAFVRRAGAGEFASAHKVPVAQ
jgi:hypothetical protein